VEPKRKTRNLGLVAEDFAAKLLLQNGYKVIERNFRSRFGEIDVVALKDDSLIFVEVKARWSLKFGRPEEAVTSSKLWKIRKTAEFYSLTHPNLPKRMRIEVVALEIEGGRVISSRILTVD
jgi:putative endonuclease